MSLSSSLQQPYRLGSVSYLNARPLLPADPSGIVFKVPAQLAIDFASGHFDAALLSIFEALRYPQVQLADNIAIACYGEVYSVFLAYLGELEAVRSIALDPDSRTSVYLLRYLLKAYYQLDPHLTSHVTTPTQARLMIGDPAIQFRQHIQPFQAVNVEAGDTSCGSGVAETSNESWNFLDLGAAWQAYTGLPFVFAAWTLKKQSATGNSLALAEKLRAMKQEGEEHKRQLIQQQQDPVFADYYLNQCLHYHLDSQEKEAILMYQEGLVRYGWLAAKAAVSYV